MTFTEKIEKLLGSNYLKEVIDEFLKFLNEVPHSYTDARSDANQLRGQIIVLSGRFTELNTKINTNTLDSGVANQEKSALINSFIQILNQLPSNYPDLNDYLEEKNEEAEWKDSQRKNTIEAYHFYFNKYPNGKYKADTIKLIAELEEVKLKQDNEIKRLALLEKERRENDKAAGESQKVQDEPRVQPVYSTAPEISLPPRAKSKKGWLIGIGVVVALVIFMMVGKNDSNNYTEPATVNEAATATPVNQQINDSAANPGVAQAATAEEKATGLSETIKAELISAIRLADDAEINASYTLNPDPLFKSFTGEALKTQLSSIEWLKSNGLNAAPTLEQQDFKNFKLSPDGLDAEVQVVETWSLTYFVYSTNKCYGKIPSHKAPQTIFLKKSENGWLTTSIVHEKLVTPDMVACD